MSFVILWWFLFPQLFKFQLLSLELISVFSEWELILTGALIKIIFIHCGDKHQETVEDFCWANNTGVFSRSLFPLSRQTNKAN